MPLHVLARGSCLQERMLSLFGSCNSNGRGAAPPQGGAPALAPTAQSIPWGGNVPSKRCGTLKVRWRRESTCEAHLNKTPTGPGKGLGQTQLHVVCLWHLAAQLAAWKSERERRNLGKQRQKQWGTERPGTAYQQSLCILEKGK